MNFIAKISCLLATCASFSAASVDLYFRNADSTSTSCLFKTFETTCYLKNGSTDQGNFQTDHNVRFRVIDPGLSSSGKFGFYLERPFFIIDGIHLSLDEYRTLESFQTDADAYGMTQMLHSLGYTPILVQFPETVRKSLEVNSRTFANLLKFLNDNQIIPFPNKAEDGFIVMGISQGGIIGRYGSYLYSKEKSASDTPIRFFASLDSPHQGAVMPRSLIATLDFWANKAEVASAEAFNDLIQGDGAEELLIYETKKGDHSANLSLNRFLFNDYRKAAEYKGYPSVLIAQGQLKGSDPTHGNKYYDLNRKAYLWKKTLGRAESSTGYSDSPTGVYAHNHMYEFGDDAIDVDAKGTTEYDFIQGSTYPFAETLYGSLRKGMLSAIPDGMTKKIGWGIASTHVSISTKWDDDTLYQKSSTFIPTASAMDMKCDGNLAISGNCAHNQSSTGFSFENPGTRSSGTAAYAVDPTHPRYNEPTSGRHIESPIVGDSINETILYGMQTDIWRILCELAKVDYSASTGKFRNPGLNGYFSPTTSCMDITKMPSIVKNSGRSQTKNFGYVRYDYNAAFSEADDYADFNLPAGWQKVATIDNGGQIPAGTVFETDIVVTKSNSNWMKAELLLTTNKQGSHQLQLSEQNIPVDGDFHTVRWTVPASMEAVRNYRWFRLVLNSDGGTVIVAKPRLITSSVRFSEAIFPIKDAAIYPNANYSIVPWSSKVSIQETGTGDNAVLKVAIPSKDDGLHINFQNTYDLSDYQEIKVSFEPGTCQNTMLYFDSKNPNGRNLVNYSLQNGIAYKILPLSKIVDTGVTPNHGYSASRLVLQAISDNETCNIKAISLQ